MRNGGEGEAPAAVAALGSRLGDFFDRCYALVPKGQRQAHQRIHDSQSRYARDQTRDDSRTG